MNNTPFPRRAVLGAAAAVGAGALISSCGGGSDGDTTGSTTSPSASAGSPAGPSSSGSAGSSSAAQRVGGVELPAYVPYAGVKPDLPGSADGTLPGFLKTPTNLVNAVEETPGDGSEVGAFVQTATKLPTPLEKNTFWKTLNKNLGATLKMNVVPAANYSAKFATVIAGGDLPDFVQIFGQHAQLQELLKAEFTDLTEYLAGDAVKEYPLLASISPINWSGCVYNGGIYGVPIPRSKIGSYLYVRGDLVDAKGLDPNPASFADFVDLCKQLTDVKANTWAIADIARVVAFAQQSLGVPNAWKEDGGEFTSAFTDPRTKQAIGAVADLTKAGCAHPDSFTAPNTQQKAWFTAGQAALFYGNYTAWKGLYMAEDGGGSHVSAMLPPDFDGSAKANTWQGKVNYSFTAIKKGDKKRIAMLLRVANWLAAPIGTEERQFLSYGVKGVDYAVKDGQPELTDTGKAELHGMGLGYVAAPPESFSGDAPLVQAEYDYQLKFLPMSIPDPTANLYSETAVNKGNVIDTNINNAMIDIVAGRKPLSSWDGAVKAWRSGGGDQIAKEYGKAFAEHNGS